MNDKTEFIVYDPQLARVRSMYADNIDVALDTLYPTNTRNDCISDHIIVFDVPDRGTDFQIVEAGWDPINLDE